MLVVSKRPREPIVVGLPHAGPMPPGALGEAVVERQRRDIEAEIGRALHVAVPAEDVGAVAKAADIAGGQQQDAAGADIGGADRELRLAHRPDQGRRLLRGEDLSHAPDLPLGQAGDALDLLRIPFLHLVADILHPVDALIEELLVLPAIAEDVPEHSVDGGNVRARTHPHIFRCVRGGPRHARVDHDEVGPLELLAFEQMLQRHRMRFGRIAAHDHDGLGVADVVVAVGHRAVAPGVGYAGDGRRMADPRLVIDVVGAPIGRELAEQIGAFVGEFRGAEPVDRIRSRLLADRLHLRTDLVDRGLPGDLGPLTVDQLHRIFQPAVAMHELAHRRALGAMRAAIDRRFPAGLLPDPHAFRHFGDHRAADRAMRADVLADGDRGAGLRRRAGFGPTDARQRQGAKSGETTGDQAGAAQERPAIEAGIGLARQRVRKRTAASLTFRSLDQHDCFSLTSWDSG